MAEQKSEQSFIEEQQAAREHIMEDLDVSATQVQQENGAKSDAPNESEPDSVESLRQQLQAAELRVRDEMLRSQAEIQNIQRRAERDVANAHKFGQEKLVKDLLAVIDSLERGIQTIDESQNQLDASVKTFRDGSALTLKMLIDTLARFQIRQLDPHGEPFDPQFHEAISMVPNPDMEPNSVMAVVQKGYTLHDRLVRPAMVVVAKGNAE